MKLSITVKNWDEFVEISRKYPEVARQYSNTAIRRTVIILQGDSIKNAPIDTGNLRGKTKVNFGDWWGSVKSDTEYAAAVHEGQAAHFPPSSALEGWVRRKFGVKNEKQVKQIAFLIARKISKSGVKSKPYMAKAIDDNNARIDKIFEEALTNIVKSL